MGTFLSRVPQVQLRFCGVAFAYHLTPSTGKSRVATPQRLANVETATYFYTMWCFFEDELLWGCAASFDSLPGMSWCKPPFSDDPGFELVAFEVLPNFDASFDTSCCLRRCKKLLCELNKWQRHWTCKSWWGRSVIPRRTCHRRWPHGRVDLSTA